MNLWIDPCGCGNSDPKRQMSHFLVHGEGEKPFSPFVDQLGGRDSEGAVLTSRFPLEASQFTSLLTPVAA